MIKEEFKQALKDKLKECDKDTFVDIIADFCSVYIRAKIFSDISNANCMQQCLNNVQTCTQEIDDFLSQRINSNFKKL